MFLMALWFHYGTGSKRLHEYVDSTHNDGTPNVERKVECLQKIHLDCCDKNEEPVSATVKIEEILYIMFGRRSYVWTQRLQCTFLKVYFPRRPIKIVHDSNRSQLKLSPWKLQIKTIEIRFSQNWEFEK